MELFFSGPILFYNMHTPKKSDVLRPQYKRKIINIFKDTANENGIAINGLVIAIEHIHGIITLPDKSKINLRQYLGKTKVKITQMIRGLASQPLRDRKTLWQKSFYDHVIRNEQDFLEKAKYIENHPEKEEGNMFSEWH